MGRQGNDRREIVDSASSLVLVFDIGLTRVKAALVDSDGQLFGSAAATYPTSRKNGDQAEQDPSDWWRAMVDSIRSLVSRHPNIMSRVGGLSITGHMHALLCVDGQRNPLGPALVLGDTRSKSQAERIAGELGQETIHEITGARLDASMPAAKIAWVAEHEPDLWAKTNLVLGVKDFLRMRLTGDNFTDPIDATATSLFDIRANQWSPIMLEATGIGQDRLPEVRAPESLAGELGADVAAEFGLETGLPVVVGGGDDIEVLGRGLVEHGNTLEHIGTTGSIMCVLDKPIFDPALALELYPHALPGRWVLGGAMTTAGAAIEWASQTLGYETVTQAMECLIPDRDHAPVFLPNLAGGRAPEWEPQARGAWVGVDVANGQGDLMYASFEGVAFGLTDILDRVVNLVGSREHVRAQGHPAQDPWLRLRAAAYNEILAVSDVDSTAIGAAMLAAGGLGLHHDLETAVKMMAPPERLIKPARDQVAALSGRRSRFRAATEALSPAWNSLATCTDPEGG